QSLVRFQPALNQEPGKYAVDGEMLKNFVYGKRSAVRNSLPFPDVRLRASDGQGALAEAPVRRLEKQFFAFVVAQEPSGRLDGLEAPSEEGLVTRRRGRKGFGGTNPR